MENQLIRKNSGLLHELPCMQARKTEAKYNAYLQ